MEFRARSLCRVELLSRHVANSARHMKLRSMSGNISPESQAVLETRKSINVLDSYMSYLDTSTGDNVVLFLHGNPTAAFLWRNVIPHVQPLARCVAPDLIGMGHSGKPDIEYRLLDHYKYLNQWIDQMNFPQKITIVCHDWGSALGFHWCNMHRDRVEAIVFMEAVLAVAPDWENIPRYPRQIYQTIRQGGEGLILKDNFMVERALPDGVLRKLSDEEMNEYRAPYRESMKSRIPMVVWCKEVPVVSDGPADVVDIIIKYAAWLSRTSKIPKLYINAEPGVYSRIARAMVKDWPNQRVVSVKGFHYMQEDSPHEIGQAIRDFLQNIY